MIGDGMHGDMRSVDERHTFDVGGEIEKEGIHKWRVGYPVLPIYTRSMPLLSVIIPTHCRPKILEECLSHLERQTVVGDIEVIIVSDGGDIETADVAKKHASERVMFFSVSPCHQGSARNQGLAHASGKYILYIGDDIFLATDACELHLKTLREHPDAALLGFITWDPAVGITPVMRWLEQSGWQFGFPKLASYAENFLPKKIQHRFTYTSHFSLSASLARQHLFFVRTFFCMGGKISNGA